MEGQPMSFRAKHLACVVLGLWVVLGVSRADAQQPRRAKPERIHAEGTIEAVAPGMIRIATAGGAFWMIRIPAKAKIKVTGTAEPGFLRPGLLVRFDALIDRRGRVQQPIDKLSVVSQTPDLVLNVFPKQDFGDPDQPAPEAKTRRGGAGAYEVVGVLTGIRKGTYLVRAGQTLLKVKLADEVRIDVSIADYGYASKGDKISCRGVQIGPNAAVAKRVTIELSKPLTGPQKKHPKAKRSKTSRKPKPNDEPPREDPG
jgi:hypothetical protein